MVLSMKRLILKSIPIIMRTTAKLLFFWISTLTGMSLNAQTDARDFKTVKYEEKVYEHPDYKLFLAGSFARADVMKVKLRVFNKSKQVIYIKPEEIEFVLDGATFHGQGNVVTVQPDGDELRVVELSGGKDMRVNQFDVVLKGFYKVDPKVAEPVKAESSTVDGGSASAVTAGTQFKCNPSVAQTNKEKSFAKYSCVYSGDRIGIIEPGNTVAVLSTGKQNFNSFPRNEIFVMEKNEPQTITIEFRKQPAAGDLTDGYKVLWDNVFKTGKAEAYEIKQTTLKIDPSKSK